MGEELWMLYIRAPRRFARLPLLLERLPSHGRLSWSVPCLLIIGGLCRRNRRVWCSFLGRRTCRCCDDACGVLDVSQIDVRTINCTVARVILVQKLTSPKNDEQLSR